MKRVPLKDRSGSLRGHALVDDEDFERIASSTWNLRAQQDYAVRRGDGGVVLMHREVLGLQRGDGQQIDHINGDGLDNRRENLRLCTHAENMQNRGTAKGVSRFRNVYAIARPATHWRVIVTLGGKQHFLGYFDDEVEAARVAEAWRREHMPFAQPDPELAALEAA